MAAKQGPYDRVAFHGKQITRRQRQALRAVEHELNADFQTMQGSWRPKTSYSGTTHTGAGVCDLYLPGMSTDPQLQHFALRVLRRVGGQAAFLRGPFCDMPWHFHSCDLDLHGMDEWAQKQTKSYRVGNDALGDLSHPDPFPYRPSPIRRWRYRDDQ